MTQWAFYERGCLLHSDDAHVVPVEDLREHEPSRSCWCEPVVNEDETVVHNSLDGREAYETGERKPS